jgi:hypothetical protein
MWKVSADLGPIDAFPPVTPKMQREARFFTGVLTRFYFQQPCLIATVVPRLNPPCSTEVADTREALHAEFRNNQKSLRHQHRTLPQESSYARNQPGRLPLSARSSRRKSRQVPPPSSNGPPQTPECSVQPGTRLTNAAFTVYMPQEEVMRKDDLYAFFERIDKAHEDEADAIADAVAYMFENPDPSQLTPSQIDRQIDLTKQVLSKHLRNGYLMQNLGEEFERFRPGPSREELNHMLNLSK